MSHLSRRDFLKLSTLTLPGLALLPVNLSLGPFDDAEQIRVTTQSVSVYSSPNDQSWIVGEHFRDELVNVYGEVNSGTPPYNPIWYRVWVGYIHRGRTQRVKVLFNSPLTDIPGGTRQLAELTIPFTQAMRYSKTYGWQPNLRLYYGSVHWIDAIDEGPDGEPWYRVFDELAGFPYHVPAIHLRPIPFEEWSPISPEVPAEKKRIEGPNVISTKTPSGEFRIFDKYPSKHMGNGNLFADMDDYELPGVPWTSFFTESGIAFHGTYWHDNFGAPMSRGCINMRIEEAKWLFRWAHPPHEPGKISNRGLGTRVTILP